MVRIDVESNVTSNKRGKSTEIFPGIGVPAVAINGASAANSLVRYVCQMLEEEDGELSRYTRNVSQNLVGLLFGSVWEHWKCLDRLSKERAH